MNQTVFTIEELEERIAPSALAFAAQDPSTANTAAPAPIGAEPGPWHPLWPVDPWPPGQWPPS
jgi:hypothetical protein